MSARESGKRRWLEGTIRVRLSIFICLFVVKPKLIVLYILICMEFALSPPGGIRGDVKGQVALLSRTNANVFDEAVRVTEGESPSRIHLIGVRVSC